MSNAPMKMHRPRRDSLIAAMERFDTLHEQWLTATSEASDVDEDDALWDVASEAHNDLLRAEQNLARILSPGCLPAVWNGRLYRNINGKIWSEEVCVIEGSR